MAKKNEITPEEYERAFQTWRLMQESDDPRQLSLPMRVPSAEFDAYTQRLALKCPEPGARQEFKEEADINTIVARFYPFAPPNMRPVQFGEQDMGLDLHSAMLSVQQAREAYQEMPQAVRDQFPTYAEFVQAVADGKVEIVPIPSGEDAAGSSAAASAEAASDSAPVPGAQS